MRVRARVCHSRARLREARVVNGPHPSSTAFAPSPQSLACVDIRRGAGGGAGAGGRTRALSRSLPRPLLRTSLPSINDVREKS